MSNDDDDDDDDDDDHDDDDDVLFVLGFLAAKIILSTFGAKFFSNIGFSLVYIYSAELFPTTLR